MALQLLIAVSMGVFSMMVHVAGLAGLLVLIPRRSRRSAAPWTILAGVAKVLLVVNGVFVLHLLEVLAYASLYLAVGAIPTFHDAFVFSAGNYATAGSDVSVRRDWRLLAAMEAANGVILLGISTAFFVSVFARIRDLEDEWTRRA
jgi:voltage-gated potassium channel